MKFLSILVAASLALTPAIASATSHGTSGNSSPVPGGLAVFARDEIPKGAIVLGILVILGGVVIGLLVGGGNNDSNNDTNGGNGAVAE